MPRSARIDAPGALHHIIVRGIGRTAYERFVVEGVDQGRRPELVGGGGLIRSSGGWSAKKALRNSGMRIMGDERILGSGQFVQSVIEQAREQYEKRTLARAKRWIWKR